uniref:Uncharacterized protein n=1 Tax=Bionectria ochroleuca TaxID=29856 RepID=A0A8H7K682_BIOOC
MKFGSSEGDTCLTSSVGVSISVAFFSLGCRGLLDCWPLEDKPRLGSERGGSAFNDSDSRWSAIWSSRRLFVIEDEVLSVIEDEVLSVIEDEVLSVIEYEVLSLPESSSVLLGILLQRGQRNFLEGAISSNSLAK